MSYCRWSSNDYQCDVYVYESDAAYETHVAGRRWIYTTPLPAPVRLSDDIEAWDARWRTVMDMHGNPEHGYWHELPDPGENWYRHATPDECADNLERLRGLGFNVPQGAIDALREETR